MIRTLGTVFEVLHIGVGLFVVIAGTALLRRKVDPAVKVLLAWGAWMLLSGVWDVFVHTIYYAQPLAVAPSWVNTVSALFGFGGPLALYAIAVYAVWRFWQAASSSPER